MFIEGSLNKNIHLVSTSRPAVGEGNNTTVETNTAESDTLLTQKNEQMIQAIQILRTSEDLKEDNLPTEIAKAIIKKIYEKLLVIGATKKTKQLEKEIDLVINTLLYSEVIRVPGSIGSTRVCRNIDKDGFEIVDCPYSSKVGTIIPFNSLLI